MQRLMRSVLFVPCDRIKMMEKALKLPTDVVIFDLEDSVAPDKKVNALNDLTSFIVQHNLAAKQNYRNTKAQVAVRINCPHSSKWGKDDAHKIAQLGVDIIVLPKVADIAALDATTTMIEDSLNFEKLKSGGIDLWVMIESAKGVANAVNIAAQSSVKGLILGCNDLTKDLKAKTTRDRKPLQYSMSQCVIAARSYDKLVIDGVYMDIADKEGLEADAKLGREFGFDGKSLIHPDQVVIVNSVFSPSQEELIYAKRVVAAWAEAAANGQSVAVLDGKLIEYLHVHEASALIRMHNQIESLRAS